MKKYFFLSIMLLLQAAIILAQAKPKTVQKEKAPTQKEMEEMRKEMENAMNEMSPEDKKMLDSMGVKLPSANMIPKLTDKQLAGAWEEETAIVPKKNTAAIAAIPPAPTTAALPAFISKVHNAVVAKLTAAEKTDAETVYQSLRQQPGINAANAAIGFWVQGRPLLATYLMGRACQDDPADMNNLNNYASMLTMTGAQHAAIPILMNLNSRFRNNSTILNNIGQAWFGMGDMDKATRYLDSAIRIYAFHSQANYTKCLIEESKGNTTGAIEALERSIKKSYSPDKESKLRKLGKKLSGKNIDFPFPMPQDPLGLEKFSWPAYPKNVKESKTLEEMWNAFREECDAEIRKLSNQSAQLEQIASEAAQKRTAALIQASNSGKPFSPLPWYAPAAALKLSYLADDQDGGMERRMTKNEQDRVNVLLKDAELEKAKGIAEEELSEKYDPLIGEGRPNPLAEYCNAVNELRNKYLETTNKQFQISQEAILEDDRKFINNQVYYAQYTNWPEDFEVVKVQAKMGWLGIIKNQVVRFQEQGPFCETTEPDKDKIRQTMKLQAFDDVACQYHSSVDLGVIEFNNDCSRFEGKLKLGAINYTRKIDSDDHDRLLNASLEIRVGAGKGIEKGPVKAEAKAEITGKMEWNDKEVTNWEVTSEVSVSAGSNLGHADKSIDIAGAKAQIGMNSSSVRGSGLLQGLNISNK